MSKPKIVILIDWYLPGTKAGGPVRSIYSLMNLLKRHFEFYIITTNHDLGSKTPYSSIVPNTWTYEADIHYYYFSQEHLNTSNMTDIIRKVDPAVVYINSFWSFNFSINILNITRKNRIRARIVLAPRGMLGKGALGLKSFKKKFYIKLAKLLGFYKNVIFHATQEQEKTDITSKFKTAHIVIAPNVNSGSVLNNKSVKKKNHIKIFYLSRIAKVKNLHFALETLKSIPKEYEVEYDIYGNLEDQEYWKYCQTLIDQLPHNINVNYIRELNFSEVQETIRNYNFLFLPTLNENFGHSIVESLLCGCPVIISDQTPWIDMEEEGAGYAISLSDKTAFINAIEKCSALNQEEFSAMSVKAINYISKKIDHDVITNQYKKLFNDGTKN